METSRPPRPAPSAAPMPRLEHAQLDAIDVELAEMLERSHGSRALRARYLAIGIRETTYPADEACDPGGHRRVVRVAGFSSHGLRQGLGVFHGDLTSETFWRSLFGALRDRGVDDIRVVVAPAFPGLEVALASVFPAARFRRSAA